MRRAVWAAGALVFFELFSAVDARAQQADAATAQALFDDGKRLMQEKKYGEACPKFAESQRLDPAGGTVLALALCHEAEGKTATAWADFKLALAEARRDRRPEREAAANEHIKALDQKLTKVLLTVAAEPEGLEVRRNGVVVGKAQWGTALPLDPGEYRFDATAPGKTPWTAQIPIEGAGKTVEVKVPVLADQPATAAVAPALTPATGTTPPVAAGATSSGANGAASGSPSVATQGATAKNYTPAIIAGGVGVLAAGVGIFFGLNASSKWDDAKRGCTNNVCPSSANLDFADSARSSADASTVAFILSGVALAAGAVLVIAAPEKERSTAWRIAPTVGLNSGGIALGGTLQ